MGQKRVAEWFRRRFRRRLYQLASREEFYLHDQVDETHWMQKKVQCVASRLTSAVTRKENIILLIVGVPGSGKSYLVTTAIARVRAAFGDGKPSSIATRSPNEESGPDMEVTDESAVQSENEESDSSAVASPGGEGWTVRSLSLETYNHRNELRCMRRMTTLLERIAGVNAPSHTTRLFPELQERVTHCLKLLREACVYVVFVIEGVDVLTKGSNDCSVTTGSYARRQGLLYFMGNLIASSDYAFSLICVTPDIRTTERLEKRVKSRFMHETIYCDGAEDRAAVFTPSGLSVLGNDIDVTLDEETKVGCSTNAPYCLQTALTEDLICGSGITSVVAAACAQLPDDSFEELGNGRLRISGDALSRAIQGTKAWRWSESVIEQLSIPEHYILVALSRMHCQGISPVTLLDIERDLKDMAQYFPGERQTLLHFQGLQRIFLHLIQQGVVDWVNYEHNWVGCSDPRSGMNDIHGTSAPCRFPQYKKYLKMDLNNLIPTNLSTWLLMAVRTLK
ncbi:origin recognition complex subunit, putative [Babesia caballi]|uniref:Origin recognition complex subunit, putative n=1 Tax=Babesia caballi TaxID=5871 RepID=A0AAV4LMX0_BABCB|nr:origin recognition complex subunit, putative [Babesia caballi]